MLQGVVLMDENKLSVTNIDSKSEDLAQQILDTEDVKQVQDLTNLFNLNSQKRNVVRILKMNDLLDKVTDQMIERFEKNPNNFSNEDLLKYMQVTENSIEKANKNLSQIEDTPPIQLTQNNVTVNLEQPGLSRESKQRVLSVVDQILKNTNATLENYVDTYVVEEDKE